MPAGFRQEPPRSIGFTDGTSASVVASMTASRPCPAGAKVASRFQRVT